MGEYQPFYKDERVHINQVESEILAFAGILEKRSPRVILELGTYRGGTVYVWTTVAPPQAKIISIDLPPGTHKDAAPESLTDRIKSFGEPKNQKIYLIKGDTQSVATLKKVKTVLKKDRVDFLFIDADHTYKSVKRDYELYSPLVKRGGIIAFHDIMPAVYCGYTFGVHELWAEIKKKHKTMEIIESKYQIGAGIGILFKGGS